MAQEQCIKGANFKTVTKYLVEKFGPDAPQKVIEQMSAEDRKLFAGSIFDGSWLPEKTFADFIYSADRIFGKGDFSLCFDMGVYNAKKSIPKLYWLFIRFGSPGFVVNSAPNFWQQTHNSGSLVIAEKTSNSFILHLKDFYLKHARRNPAFCHGLQGYFTGVLELSGAKDVRMYELQCGALGAPYCIFRGEWK